MYMFFVPRSSLTNVPLTFFTCVGKLRQADTYRSATWQGSTSPSLSVSPYTPGRPLTKPTAATQPPFFHHGGPTTHAVPPTFFTAAAASSTVLRACLQPPVSHSRGRFLLPVSSAPSAACCSILATSTSPCRAAMCPGVSPAALRLLTVASARHSNNNATCIA